MSILIIMDLPPKYYYNSNFLRGGFALKNLTYIQGAFILAFTNLLTGTISFIYRVFLSKAIGSEGMGVYQLVLPLYSLLITLVSGGITTSVSKLVAEQASSHKFRNMYKIIKIGSAVIGAWSFSLCILIFINADFLANTVLKDSRTLFSIMAFTPGVFFISISAILKGFFYGQQDVNPPALIDVLEKLIRLGGLLVATYILLPYGIEYICAGVMAAMAVGELISLILLYLFYRIRKTAPSVHERTDRTVHIVGRLLRIAIPLSISGALMTILDMIDAIMIPMQLRAAGYGSSNALSLYGELTGMVMPLLFYPFIIVSSLGTTLVPAITTSFTLGNWTALNKKCNDSLKITSVIGFASTALFLIFPWELCRIFFNCPEAGDLLFCLSFVCIFEYWQFTLFAILNGIGLQDMVLKFSIVTIIISILSIYYLIPLPGVGIYGFIIGFAVSSVLITLWSLAVLRTFPKISIDFKNTLIKPFISFIGMVIVTRSFNLYLTAKGVMKSNMIISSSAGLVFFFTALLVTGTFTYKQLRNTLVIK